MSAAFRAAVREALAAADGGPLGRRVRAATITAIVADARGDGRDAIALEELVAALERAGIPRGRQYVLLGDADASALPARERSRALRAALGIPVIAHDPARQASFTAGVLADGTPVELDDELREAEEIVIATRFANGRGGPLALWPGLASSGSRAAESRAAPPGNARERLARAISAFEHAPALFALAWDAGDPARVRAGEPAIVYAAALAAGWFDGGGA